MFDQIVKLSIKNRWLVLIVFLFIGAFGVYTRVRTSDQYITF